MTRRRLEEDPREQQSREQFQFREGRDYELALVLRWLQRGTDAGASHWGDIAAALRRKLHRSP